MDEQGSELSLPVSLHPYATSQLSSTYLPEPSDYQSRCAKKPARASKLHASENPFINRGLLQTEVAQISKPTRRNEDIQYKEEIKRQNEKINILIKQQNSLCDIILKQRQQIKEMSTVLSQVLENQSSSDNLGKHSPQKLSWPRSSTGRRPECDSGGEMYDNKVYTDPGTNISYLKLSNARSPAQKISEQIYNNLYQRLIMDFE